MVTLNNDRPDTRGQTGRRGLGTSDRQDAGRDPTQMPLRVFAQIGDGTTG